MPAVAGQDTAPAQAGMQGFHQTGTCRPLSTEQKAATGAKSRHSSGKPENVLIFGRLLKAE